MLPDRWQVELCKELAATWGVVVGHIFSFSLFESVSGVALAGRIVKVPSCRRK
jgi:energy-converting hydrogenase Eha subunit H